MVGLSLSFCVSDILNGTVAESDVEKIITGTKAATPADWRTVIDDYRKYYWSADPDEGEAIALRLLFAGKIDQPRLRGEKIANIADGHWLPDD